jgi:hypothetical protein
MAVAGAWSPADAGISRADEVALDVVKPPDADLRIRWSATTHEEGGEFLVTRQGPGGPASEVARVRPRGEGRYEVTEPGAAGSWVYRLRYRDRHGRDRVLATIRLNVDRVAPGRALLTTAADAQPVAVQTVAVLAIPETWSAWPGAGETAAADPARWPPSPPP